MFNEICSAPFSSSSLLVVPQQSFPHQTHILFSFRFYYHNPLSPISAAYTSMGVELFAGAWETYQGHVLKKQNDTSSLTTTHHQIASQ